MNTFDINGVQTEIIYEDRDVIAFVKPAGVLSQSSASCEASVLEYLDAYGNGAFTAHPIHRLDRNTAGVMICAKNKTAAAALSALIADGSMHKEYLAAVLEEDGTGKKANPTLTTAAGKTGTAQTGVIKNGQKVTNSWFCGFFPLDNPKYAVTVLSENAKGGCGDVFAAIADGITEMKSSDN